MRQSWWRKITPYNPRLFSTVVFDIVTEVLWLPYKIVGPRFDLNRSKLLSLITTVAFLADISVFLGLNKASIWQSVITASVPGRKSKLPNLLLSTVIFALSKECVCVSTWTDSKTEPLMSKLNPLIVHVQAAGPVRLDTRIRSFPEIVGKRLNVTFAKFPKES